MPSRRFLVPFLVTFLLAAIFLQMAWMAHANSATWDEPDHSFAAYMQWRGDFGLNPEHPPLVKFLATFPIRNWPLHLPTMLDHSYRLEAAIDGRKYLAMNDAYAILWRERLAASVLTLLLAVLVFVAGREFFGTTAGLLALALIAFDPTLIGHSALLTTDAAQACFMFWAIYAFYRYCNAPNLWRLVTVGLVVGLALASKHSCVFLAPMLILIGVAEVFGQRHFFPHRAARPALQASLRMLGALTVICLLSVLVLWSFYGFRYQARPDGVALFPAFDAQLAHVPGHLSAVMLGAFAHAHLLPESYLYGFAHILTQAKIFHSYLLGVIHPLPVWYYFPVAILIKSTLTFLILLAVLAWSIASGRFRPARELLYLFIPVLVYMSFAMAGGMDIGIRHILPIYIFLAVAIGGALARLIEHNRAWIYAAAVLLVFQSVSVLRAMPAYVSYANEAFGGPANVYRYLSDSSGDWGQQLYSVRRYLVQHNIHDCWFAYFGEGVIDMRSYGIPCKPLITADSPYFEGSIEAPPTLDGTVLVSSGVLTGFEYGPAPLNPYEQFKSLRPVDIIDSSVFVYQGHFDIPLAAALSLSDKAQLALAAHKPAEALDEAQQAIRLAPDSAPVNQTLGMALDASGRRDQARPYYEHAFIIARTIQPGFQAGLLAPLAARLVAWN